jgi:hypothetical protein
MTAKYVILTACKNEEQYIGKYAEAIASQTHPPSIWVVMDDGSTDGTVKILNSYQGRCPALQVIELGPRRERSFGAKYRALQTGYARIKDQSFDFVSIVDADIEVEGTDYYRRLLGEFERNPRLGVGGGVICERKNGVFQERPTNVLWSVAGGEQTFRRECWDVLGGYQPLPHGGSDCMAALRARKLGWETRSFRHLHALHYRPTSTANGALRGLYRQGMLDASVGGSLTYMVFKGLRRLTVPPLVVGACALMAGFAAYRLQRRPCLVEPEVAEFLRREQLDRIRARIARRSNGEALQEGI